MSDEGEDEVVDGPALLHLPPDEEGVRSTTFRSDLSGITCRSDLSAVRYYIVRLRNPPTRLRK